MFYHKIRYSALLMVMLAQLFVQEAVATDSHKAKDFDMNDAISAENGGVFSKGEPMPAQYSKYFSGQAWLQMLVPGGSEWNCPIGNVTFAPGCRNNWHSHPGGQILLVTAGHGWYQEFGQPPRALRAGDVVRIPANTKHWHGASKDSWFSHLSVETNVKEGPVTWMEQVNEADYSKLP